MFENAKGFKGFKKGLVCKGKKYAENTVFEEKDAVICKSGMHYCTNPFDVLDYYDLVNENGEFNDFAEVEALDPPDTDDGKKFCTKKLKVGAKLSFSGFIKICIDYMMEKTSPVHIPIGSSGDGAKINSTGEDSVICCAGNDCTAKAKVGSWITLAEWRYSEGKERWQPVCVKT